MMRIGLTGTPGVGKTTVASILSARFTVIKIVDLAAEKGYLGSFDDEFGAKEIDIESLASALDKYKSPDADDLVMVVDDVWTTGTSMRDFIKETYPGYLKAQVKKWVVFARRPPDDGTRALFTMPG